MDIYKKMMNVLVAVKKNNISVFLRFVSAGTKFELKRHGSRISFGLPVSFMYSKNSLKRNMMIFSDNDTDYDSSGAKLEAINRSHTLERIDMGVSIALETIKCGNFSLLLEPEIAFAGGVSILRCEKDFTLSFNKNQWYVTKKSEKPIKNIDYAVGAKLGMGLCLQYNVREKIEFAILPHFSRLWSSVFRNKNQRLWLVTGIEGDLYEVRFNSLVYGVDFRVYLHHGR